jgi:hypothetical protein
LPTEDELKEELRREHEIIERKLLLDKEDGHNEIPV